MWRYDRPTASLAGLPNLSPARAVSALLFARCNFLGQRVVERCSELVRDILNNEASRKPPGAIVAIAASTSSRPGAAWPFETVTMRQDPYTQTHIQTVRRGRPPTSATGKTGSMTRSVGLTPTNDERRGRVGTITRRRGPQ